MSVEDQKPMPEDSEQSKLEAIRARFRARSVAGVDAALQAVTERDQSPVNPDQDAPKDAAPSVDTSEQRASRRKGGANRSGRAKRTGKGVSTRQPKAAAPQVSQSKDPLLDKLTDLLSSPDAVTLAAPEPIVAATAGMDTMSDEDRMAAEWAAALAEVERQYGKIEPGQVWARKTEIRGEEVSETIHILEIRSDGIPVIKQKLNGEDNIYAILPNTVEELQALLRQGNYQLGAPASPDVSSVTPEPWTEERLWAQIPDGANFTIVSPDRKLKEGYRRERKTLFAFHGDVFLLELVNTDDILAKLNQADPWYIDVIESRATQPSGEQKELKGRDPKGYDDLRDGDIWVVRDADGKFVKGLRINATFGFASTGDFVNAESNVQEIDGKLVFPEKVESAEAAEAIRSRDWPREEFQQALRDGGYVLEVAGEQNTKASGTRVELPKFDDQIPRGPEASRQELVGPPTLNEALAKVEEVVAQTRKQLAEVEFEQKKQEGVLRGIRRVLGTLVGKDIDLGPQVTERRVEYQANLAQLLNLRIESLKRQKLEGKKLREEIAGLSREFEFEEGERLDDARYQIRLGEDAVTLKEKWHKVLEGAKRSENIYTPKDGYSEVTGQKEWYNKWALVWGSAKYAGEAVGRGLRVTGETYNKITKTRTGKVVTMAAGAAGAATLAFASGGAALGLAGVAMAAKRAAAGAGVALAAEEGMGIMARGYRGREATKNVESMLERLEARGVIGSDEGWDELLHTLSQRNIDGLVDRDLARRKWALRRKAIAMFGGTLMGTGAAAQLIGIGVQEAREAIGGSGAVERVAARLPGAAAAASAAEASASAPSGSAAASAAEASASATSGAPSAAAGKVEGALRTSYSRGIDEVLDRARAESLGKVLFETRTIASGDTIWKYATAAGKMAGLESTIDQQRFASLLRTALNEKLATMSPEAAKAAGFIPGPDGKFSADWIGANKQLDLSKVLSSADMNSIMEQVADTATPTGGAVAAVVEERATGVYDDGRVANVKDSLAWKDANYAPGEVANVVAQETVTPAKAVVETAVDAKATLMTEFQSFKKGDILSYIQRLPREEQAEIFRSMRRTVGDLFSTPETSIYSDSPQAQYLFTDHPEFAKVSMSRVLEDHQTLSSKAFYMYDRTTNPLHWTQMQEMGKFAEAVRKTLGKDLALPLKQESIDEYVLRVATIARATGKTIPGLRMVN